MPSSAPKLPISELPDETVLPGHQYSLGEMRAMIESMRAINSAFYGMVFAGGVPHAFIEFCGLQAAYIDTCQQMLNDGIEFPFVSTHSGVQEGGGMAAHTAAYLGEKFNCVYGFAMGPEAKKAFAAYAFEEH